MPAWTKIDPIERLNLTLSAGAVAASALLAPVSFSASVAAGALLEAVNFRSLHRSTMHLFSGELAGARPWSALFGLRFVLLGVGMYVALSVGAHPVGLALGLSCILPAVIVAAWRHQPTIASDAEVPPPDDPSWDEWNPWLARQRDREEEL